MTNPPKQFDRDSIVAKIRGLLELSRGTTSQSEAEATLAKAHKLMEKHQVEMEEVYKTITKDSIIIQRTTWKGQWVEKLGQALMALLPVKTGNTKDKHIMFIGTEEDVTIAEILLRYLYDTMEYGVKSTYRKARKAGAHTTGLKTSYRYGFTETVIRRALLLKRNEATAATTALVPLNQALNDFVRSLNRPSYTPNARPTKANNRGLEAGIDAGSRVKLNDPRKELGE